ncbi:DinB family protein [Candidatus Thalassolituus haligoni]|uniref:DinB family protein n=1 Tax=Candidatus Thalassolituus haligoni TaxID=3100113 RepID=UPI0035174FA4
MSLKSYFELMAEYNQGMNESIYQAASKLSETDLAEDKGAFFGSIINTLNHILVGDTIWLQRFANHLENFPALDYVRVLETPKSLDTVLYSDFSELKEKRGEMDEIIKFFTKELTDNVISEPFSYKNTKGQAFIKNFGHVLQHFFNHQTHHRGQVSTLLYQHGIDIGVTDLLVNIPSVE